MLRAVMPIMLGLGLLCFGEDCLTQPHGNICLSATSDGIAKEVCLDENCSVKLVSLIDELGELTDRCKAGDAGTDALLLRQQITEAVLTASLQVDGFLAEIDSETGQIRAVHDTLTDRRDEEVGKSNLGSAVGTGGGAVGSALALVNKTAVTLAGNWVSATFGGFGALYTFLAIHQAGGPKGCFPDLRQDTKKDVKDCPRAESKDGESDCLVIGSGAQERQSSGCSPRMLYQLFNPGQPAGFHSEYPPTIENHLNGISPRSKGNKTRRQELIAGWGMLSDSEKNLLTFGNLDGQKFSIDDLTKRANKVADLRAIVARMNRELGGLTSDLRCSPAIPSR